MFFFSSIDFTLIRYVRATHPVYPFTLFLVSRLLEVTDMADFFTILLFIVGILTLALGARLVRQAAAARTAPPGRASSSLP